MTFSTRTDYLLDGANVVGERLNGEYVSYLRGANLISRTSDDGTDFYLFNAHGDVTGLADSTGVNTRAYDYDAFGVEKDPDPLDENPFRYCGEYFDRETETYYLRARYYDPTIGRFTQQDTHWTTANSIYGDNPQKINEREDKLGLKSYSYAPQITAVMQSGNLYVYGVNNPIHYVDQDGNVGILASIAIGAVVGALISGSAQIIKNVVAGEAWTDGLGRAMLAGAASGAISVLPIPGVGPWATVAITGAVGNLVGQLIVGEITSAYDVMTALAIGAVSGVIGKASADLLACKFQSYFGTLTKNQQKQFLSRIGKISNRELSSIRAALKHNIPVSELNKLIEKYGYDVIISAVVSATMSGTVQ